MPSRLVQPDTTKIEISDGDWLLVLTRLSAGDQFDSFERMYLKNPDGSYVLQPDGRLVVSPSGSRMALITAYLLDWSFVGLDDKPLRIRDQPVEFVTSALRALDTASFNEVHDAIDAHDTKQALARAAQKKTSTGSPESTPISRSVSDSAGATSGATSSTPTSTSS